MKVFGLFIFSCLLVVMTACGHGDSFVLNGGVEDASAMNLRIVYYVNGKVFTGVTAVTDGKFKYEGKTSGQTLIEIYDNDYRILGRVMADAGDDIDITLNRAKPYTIRAKGNELTVRWTEFLNANSESLASLSSAEHNAPIAEYIQANPTDQLSAMLLVTEYDSSVALPLPADSLWNMIAEEARPIEFTAAFAELSSRVSTATTRSLIVNIPYLLSGNKTKLYAPSDQKLSVLAFTDNESGRDSIIEALEKLDAHRKNKRFDILDLSLDTDTMTWRRSVRDDSVRWIQGWVAGSISGQALNHLGIPSLPFFIVADSTGHQLWRGRSVTEMRSFTLDQLSKL